MSQANNNQQAAQQGLQQMMDQLNQNDLKLEQLAREIRKLLEDVQKLRADEAALNKDTIPPGQAAAAVRKLADRQGTLQQNTIIVQKKAENTQHGQAAAFIGEAADQMGNGAAALFGNKQADSLKPQTDAIAALDAAIEELKKVDDACSRN